jgi:hypothetical protein
MRKQVRPVFSILMPIVIGSIGFSNIARQPRFAAFHTVDIVQLLASGMCLGVALTAFFIFLRTRNVSKSPADEQ